MFYVDDLVKCAILVRLCVSGIVLVGLFVFGWYMMAFDRFINLVKEEGYLWEQLSKNNIEGRNSINLQLILRFLVVEKIGNPRIRKARDIARLRLLISIVYFIVGIIFLTMVARCV